MSTRLSRHELIAIADKLIHDRAESAEEAEHLMQQFEENVLHPLAPELIMIYADEFESVEQLVDFALSQEPERRLSRQELIEVVRKVMTLDVTSEIHNERLINAFEANVPYPRGAILLIKPPREFESPEDLVDYALAYKPPAT